MEVPIVGITLTNNRRTTPRATWPTGFCHAQTSTTDRHTVTVCGQYSTNTRAKGKNRRAHRVGSRLRTITKIIVQEKRGKTMTSSVYTTTDTATNQPRQIYRTWVFDGWAPRPTAWIPAPWDTGHEPKCTGHLLPTGNDVSYFRWVECGCPNAVVAQKPFDLLPAWRQVDSPDELTHPGDLWRGNTVDVAPTPSAFTTKR